MLSFSNEGTAERRGLMGFGLREWVEVEANSEEEEREEGWEDGGREGGWEDGGREERLEDREREEGEDRGREEGREDVGSDVAAEEDWKCEEDREFVNCCIVFQEEEETFSDCACLCAILFCTLSCEGERIRVFFCCVRLRCTNGNSSESSFCPGEYKFDVDLFWEGTDDGRVFCAEEEGTLWEELGLWGRLSLLTSIPLLVKYLDQALFTGVLLNADPVRGFTCCMQNKIWFLSDPQNSSNKLQFGENCTLEFIKRWVIACVNNGNRQIRCGRVCTGWDANFGANRKRLHLSNTSITHTRDLLFYT